MKRLLVALLRIVGVSGPGPARAAPPDGAAGARNPPAAPQPLCAAVDASGWAGAGRQPRILWYPSQNRNIDPPVSRK